MDISPEGSLYIYVTFSLIITLKSFPFGLLILLVTPPLPGEWEAGGRRRRASVALGPPRRADRIENISPIAVMLLER